MNKIFKVIWNPATGSYNVASETAKSRGKKSGRSKLLISALVAGGLLSSFGALADNYEGQPVDYGNGSAGDGWVAIGKNSKANTFVNGSGASTALGYDAIAEGEYSSAIGSRTHAIGGASMAFGVSAQAIGDRSVALGASSVATGGRSMALGRYAKTNGFTSLAIGDTALADGEKTIALGNTAQAYEIMSIALGDHANASKEYSMALGASSVASAANAIAVGRDSAANGTDSIALGRLSLASAANAIAMGAESEAAENATAIGFNADAIGKSSLALGDNASAGETNSIAIGQGSVADKVGSIALGSNSRSAGENAIALGNNSNAGGKNSLAFGFGATANGDNAVAIGANSSAGADNTVSVGSSSLKRKIVNMGNGDINNVSSDAINGSQLYAISKSVSDRLGGYHDDPDNVINSDGTLKAPTYYLQSGQYNNVGEALQSIDNNTLHWDEKNKKYSASHTVFNADGTTKSVQAKSIITNVADGTISDSSSDAVNGSQLYDLKQDALLWNGSAFSAKHGDNGGTDSKITNVADGAVSASSKDAVNGSQLKTTQDDVDANTANIATNTSNITTLKADVDTLEKDALLWNGTAFSAKHGTSNTDSKITNVLAGTVSSTSTDAINGTQLQSTASTITSYLGGGAAMSNDGVFTGPQYNIGGKNYTNVGAALTALDNDALLWDATANSNTGAFSAAHGTLKTASKITNVANGDILANSYDAINGSQLYSLADSFTSYLGGGADINNAGVLIAPTYTIGSKTYNNVGDALNAINSSFSTSISDALLWDSTANKFSAKHGGTNSIITNVADGTISSTSSDAVNGSQLYDTSKYIADALGGDAEVNADGTMTAPTYSIANEDYHSVGEALDALDDNALLWDEDAGAYNASHDGNASKITNVAAGDLSTTSTDAVNGSQLNATNILVTQNSQMINQLAGNTSETYIEENGAGINYVRTNDNGLAFNDASASGIGATAVGYNSVAEGDSSVAIGYNSVASHASSVAIGQDSSSSVDTGIALGSSSVSSRVIVKGSRNTSVTENGVVIGYDTTDGELLGALSIGDDGKYRQIINVADGSEAHDAVTVRQLQNAIGAVATTPTKYFHANSTAEDSLAVGEDSLAMGAKTIVNGNAGIGIGLNTLVLADAINGIAIGSNARANHADSIAMGNGSQTTRGAQTNYTAYNMDAPQNSVGEFSVGSEDGQRQITNVAAGSADTDAVNVGQLKVTDAQVSQNTQSITNLNTQVTNLDTRVTNIENGIGDIVTTGSTKYFKTNTDGADANAQGKDSVAIGSGSIAAADNSVALGTGSVADEENTISVGSSTNQRRITNVAAGVNATDAVNVSQLKSSEAGGVRYDTKADGSIDYSNITLGGGNGGTTRISNVSAGVNNNDAVNYAQLKQSVQETKQYTDQRMVEMDNKLSKTESKLSGGIASAMAMTGLPQAYTPGASMASIGGGTYNGESAVALGVSMVSANGRWVYKLQGSTNSQGEYSAALGAGIQW
ncbi:TPA: YadA-like family protein [Escherichia coli]|uniref:YadA-like family protein n=1 Tax=Escherichia coli TaxID=562 RepID=UPI0015730D39|nr:YadA-like family protein [Escherichia coli]EHB6889174.1 adhesin [Escherichia coli]EHB6957337.1 adhesin [Escherichia coli]EJR0841185.1 YadA-like family protein [Escherichia coli]EKG3168919.1 YadA-like family protein [Escherichia coli]EKG6908425.1 YadA-like family protein [Escherichia coli]